jgi:hypothetical protein
VPVLVELQVGMARQRRQRIDRIADRFAGEQRAIDLVLVVEPEVEVDRVAGLGRGGHDRRRVRVRGRRRQDRDQDEQRTGTRSQHRGQRYHAQPS